MYGYLAQRQIDRKKEVEAKANSLTSHSREKRERAVRAIYGISCDELASRSQERSVQLPRQPDVRHVSPFHHKFRPERQPEAELGNSFIYNDTYYPHVFLTGGGKLEKNKTKTLRRPKTAPEKSCYLKVNFRDPPLEGFMRVRRKEKEGPLMRFKYRLEKERIEEFRCSTNLVPPGKWRPREACPDWRKIDKVCVLLYNRCYASNRHGSKHVVMR